MQTVDGIARRARMDLYTEAEKAISDAMYAVEKAGCDVRLTDAVCLLSAAKDSVADHVEDVKTARRFVSTKEWTP